VATPALVPKYVNDTAWQLRKFNMVFSVGGDIALLADYISGVAMFPQWRLSYKITIYIMSSIKTNNNVNSKLPIMRGSL